MKPYTYSDRYFDLGDLGEHECDVTAFVVSDPGEIVRMAITRAIVKVRIKGHPVQELDVTVAVREDYEWLLEIEKSYRHALELYKEDPA